MFMISGSNKTNFDPTDEENLEDKEIWQHLPKAIKIKIIEMIAKFSDFS